MATICRLVSRIGGTEDEIAQVIADRLVEYSLQCMNSKTRVSPFESMWHNISCPAQPDYLVLLGDAAREGMFFRGGVCSRKLRLLVHGTD
jgi:protein phosphatase PTC7